MKSTDIRAIVRARLADLVRELAEAGIEGWGVEFHSAVTAEADGDSTRLTPTGSFSAAIHFDAHPDDPDEGDGILHEALSLGQGEQGQPPHAELSAEVTDFIEGLFDGETDEREDE